MMILAFGNSEYQLKDNEYMIVANYEKEIYDEVMNRNSKININMTAKSIRNGLPRKHRGSIW